jgi:hypothetical protein
MYRPSRRQGRRRCMRAWAPRNPWPLDEPGGERSEGLGQDVAVRATDGELERINVDMDIVELEDGSWIVTR